LAGRIAAVAIAAAFLAVVGVQYAHIIERNVSLANDLRGVERDVVTLRDKQREQLRTIDRLSDPQGAIPEIHDRLRLVRQNETIIYLKGAPSPAP
jgi:hypothetical protein